MKDLAVSAIGASVAEFSTAPISNIKTNYVNSGQITSLSQIVHHIYSNNGIKGFYRGSTPAVFSQASSQSLKYSLYRAAERNNLSNNRIINGVVTGVIANTLLHPIEVLKIHWQMGNAMNDFIKKNNITKSLYVGYSKSFGKSILGSALYLPLYDTIKEKTNGNVMISSLLSSTLSVIIIHPMDFLKTRQIGYKPLYESYNPLYYYKGLSLNLVRIVPHFWITMVVIETLSNS